MHSFPRRKKDTTLCEISECEIKQLQNYHNPMRAKAAEENEKPLSPHSRSIVINELFLKRDMQAFLKISPIYFKLAVTSVVTEQ